MTDRRKDRERILSDIRSYVDLGLPVIPLCAHNHEGYSEKHIATCAQAGKIPLIKGWADHAETTTEQVTSWIREFRSFNIGLPLGNASGYIGIDIDGVAGEDMLDEMADGEDIPTTWEYTTGAGRRLLYAIPVGMKTKKFVNMAKGKGDHVECSILCDGQQTVLPPSIHYTGKIYEWAEGNSPSDIDCAQAPEWLLDLVREEPKKRYGTIDLTQPVPTLIPDSSGTYVAPILVTDAVLPSEFIEFESLEVELIPPDTDYVGKIAKEQEEDKGKVTEKELMQKITAGSRDNQMTKVIGSFCAKLRGLGKDYVMVMSKNHNQQFCDPPLDDYAIEAKVNHFWELEKMKSSKFREAAGNGDDKKRFSPSEVAQVVIESLEEQGYCLKVDEEHPIVWACQRSHGPWHPMDSRSGSFFTHIRDALSNPEMGGDPTWTTIRHYKDTANSVVVELRAKERIWRTNASDQDTQTLTSYPYIPLAGGKLLNWRTGELLPWDPESNLTYVLPVEYDPDAKIDSWENRLKEWLPDAGSRLIMQEFIGYSLVPYMGFEKALVIQGEGANGKSIFLEAIQGLLGYKVVDSINMRHLFSRFGQVGLMGKILNIVNEAGSEYLRGGHADDFKNLVSGGRVVADVKNLAPITFNNTAKFIFASNHDIKTGDKSEGWLRRVLIVPFEQDFRNSKIPKFEIMEAIRKEYAGIFNWAIEGLRRLMDQQDFSASDSASKKKLAYTRENDISADFFGNCLEIFDLASIHPEGKSVRAGTPTALINTLFGYWIEYRESTVQKKTEHITKFLERKHDLNKHRTTHTLLVTKVMTECWIGLRVNIKDTGFLELLINEPMVKFHELKDYALRRLAEIDANDGYTGPPNGNGGQSNVKDFPEQLAQ